jgi:hypothetical protein
VKILTGTGIVLFGVGLFALFAGDQVASAEEGIANSLGNLLSNTWVAVGLILAGGILFANETGLLSKAVKAV